MKKILFVIGSLGSGGAEKSLINLLHKFDCSQYDITLYLFKPEGLFYKSAHDLFPDVKIISAPREAAIFLTPFKASFKYFIDNKNWVMAFKRFLFSVFYHLDKNTGRAYIRTWKILSSIIPVLEDKYDTAVAYLELFPISFVCEKATSVRKIGWIHSDYIHHNLNPEFDRLYFERLDKIVTVSETCKLTLDKVFPEHKNKIDVIRNIIDVDLIRKMAESEKGYNDNYSGIRILTIGRLAQVKGYDFALKACRSLVDKGYELRWYALGEGPEKENIKKEIKRLELEDRFILLGTKVNPYPYLLEADLYAHLSRYEGLPVVITEAKALCRPIIASNIPPSYEVLKDGETGIIVNLDNDSIVEGMCKLLDDKSARNEMTKKLQEEIDQKKIECREEFNKVLSII